MDARSAPADKRTTGATDGPAVSAYPADAETTAMSLCLRLLAAQPRTRAQVAAALHRRGTPVEVADRVLTRLQARRLVDDVAFARAWVESRHAGRGLAPQALSRELLRRGIDPATAAEAVAAIDSDAQLEVARALACRRAIATRALPPQTRLRRLVAQLARKGYPPSMALQAAREALGGESPALGDAYLSAVDEPPVDL